MTKHLQRDLDAVYHDLLSMSTVVEEMIDQAALALIERQYELAAKVIATDEAVDRREVKIEEECLKILALHQPVAIDLRRIASVIKINNDLERIADLAVNVAQRSLSLDEFLQFPCLKKFREWFHSSRKWYVAAWTPSSIWILQPPNESCRWIRPLTNSMSRSSGSCKR